MLHLIDIPCENYMLSGCVGECGGLEDEKDFLLVSGGGGEASLEGKHDGEVKGGVGGASGPE